MSGLTAAGSAPAEVLLDGYVEHLRAERGLSPRSIETYVPKVRRFLAQVGTRDLSELTAADVSNAVLSQAIAGAGGHAKSQRLREVPGRSAAL